MASQKAVKKMEYNYVFKIIIIIVVVKYCINYVNMLHVQLIQDMYKLIQDKLVGVQASHCSQALIASWLITFVVFSENSINFSSL